MQIKIEAQKCLAPQRDAEISARDIPLVEIDQEAKITGLPVAEQAMR